MQILFEEVGLKEKDNLASLIQKGSTLMNAARLGLLKAFAVSHNLVKKSVFVRMELMSCFVAFGCMRLFIPLHC